MKRRILSIITALALCLSLCPAWAFAVESEIVPDDEVLADDLCTHGELVDECPLCPIEALIAALPRALTEDNAETVRWQLDEILDLWRELSEDEQEQIDLSPCWDLQAALDEANVPAPIDEPPANALAEVRLTDGTTTYLTTEAEFQDVFWDNDTAGAETTVTLLDTVTLTGKAIPINYGTFTLDLNGRNINFTGSIFFSVAWDGISTSGGSLTIRGSGTVHSGGCAVQVSDKGTVTLAGGAFSTSYEGGASVQVRGGGTLNVSNAGVEISYLSAGKGSIVALTAGKYGAILTSDTEFPPGRLLKSGYAYYRDGKPVELKELPGYEPLTGPFTVGECTHDGAATPNDDGATHGGNCPYCGTKFEAESHTLDKATKTCAVCKTPLKVQVEIGNDTTYYGDFGPAWAAASGKTATVTLLAGVTHQNMLNISDSSITLNGGDYTHSILGFMVSGGQLDISSGTFRFAVALMVSGGTVRLSGGEFINTSGQEAISCTPGSNLTVGDFLLNHDTQNTPHYAYFNEAGKPIALTEGQTSLTGTVKVQECDHTGVDPTPNNDGTHSLKCPYCGYTGPVEGCSYGTEYQHDDTNHWQTCEVCGYENKEAHTLKLAVQANGTAITASDACDCSYQKDLGTVTLTVPASLTYHDGQTIAWTASEGLSLSFKWDASGAGFADQPISAVGLDAGEHTLNIEVSHDSQTASSSITVTVNPATLTEAMVEPIASATYSGAAQEPAVTVKQGDTTLAEGKDYDVAYSITDFTNAGTITVTITGKGNYEGTVKKTYTIEKATLTADGTHTASGIYGAKLSALTIDALTAKLGETPVPGTWKLTGDTIPNVGDSGEYTATFTPESGAGNYETLTAQVTLTIGKAAASTPQAGTLNVQNGYERAYTFALAQLLPTLASGQTFGGDVTYTLKAVNITEAGYYTGGAEISGSTLTLPIQKVEADTEGQIGTVIVTLSCNNFEDVDATINVCRVNKEPVTIEGVTAENATYDGKAHNGYTGTPTAGAYTGGFTFTYAKADGTSLEDKPIDAGSYTVTITLDENDRYTGSRVLSFTIEKASITITAANKSATVGSAQPELTYTVSGLASGDELATKPTLTCDADMSKAGSYPITASGAAVPNTENYETEIAYVDGTLTVTAKPSSNPGSGSSYVPPSTSTLPVTTTGQNSSYLTTTTTAAPTASTSSGKATATVDTAMGNEIVKQAVVNRSEEVVIAPKVTGSVTKAEVSIPASTVGQIRSQTNASLTIATPVANVTIPNGGLGSLSGTSGTVTVTAEKTGNHVELTVTAGGRTVTSVPGGLTLTVPAYTTPGTVAVMVHDNGTREVVRKSVADNGSVMIPLDGSAELEIVDNSKYFADVPSTSWAADAVAFASSHELFNGTGANQFSPNLPMSRGMLATVLHNLESNPYQPISGVFADVNNGAWYAEGVAWAAAHGIVTGYGGGQFGPNDNITREQLAVMLWRYAGSPAATDRELHFADAYRASDWALEALRWATESGIINGKGNGILDPTGQATRAETAQMLKNFMENQ